MATEHNSQSRIFAVKLPEMLAAAAIDASMVESMKWVFEDIMRFLVIRATPYFTDAYMHATIEYRVLAMRPVLHL